MGGKASSDERLRLKAEQENARLKEQLLRYEEQCAKNAATFDALWQKVALLHDHARAFHGKVHELTREVGAMLDELEGKAKEKEG